MVMGLPKALPQEVQAALPAHGHTTPQPAPPPPQLTRAQKLEILQLMPPGVQAEDPTSYHHHTGASPAEEYRGSGGPPSPPHEGKILGFNL